MELGEREDMRRVDHDVDLPGPLPRAALLAELHDRAPAPCLQLAEVLLPHFRPLAGREGGLAVWPPEARQGAQPAPALAPPTSERGDLAEEVPLRAGSVRGLSPSPALAEPLVPVVLHGTPHRHDKVPGEAAQRGHCDGAQGRQARHGASGRGGGAP